MEEKRKIRASTILVWVFAILFIASVGYIIWLKLPEGEDGSGKKLDKSSVLSVLESVIDDFSGESRSNSISTQSAVVEADSVNFDSFFNFEKDLYIDVTEDIKNQIQDNIPNSSSIVSQYYSFIMKPFVLGAFDYESRDFNIGEIFPIYRTLFSDELQSEPTAFGYCETTENTILMNFYDMGIITQNVAASGVSLLITLDDDDEGYVLEFMVETENGSSTFGDLTYWRTVKNNNLFLENMTHDTFAEIQILQYRPESDSSHFNGILDANFAQGKIFGIREGSSWNYTTNLSYLSEMGESQFELLKNKYFVETQAYTLLERNSEFFANEING